MLLRHCHRQMVSHVYQVSSDNDLDHLCLLAEFPRLCWIHGSIKKADLSGLSSC